jgi:hypothetical protein
LFAAGWFLVQQNEGNGFIPAAGWEAEAELPGELPDELSGEPLDETPGEAFDEPQSPTLYYLREWPLDATGGHVTIRIFDEPYHWVALFDEAGRHVDRYDETLCPEWLALALESLAISLEREGLSDGDWKWITPGSEETRFLAGFIR